MRKFLSTQLVKKLFVHVQQIVYIQVAIGFIYTPILIYWGMPISLVSIVGNLIFTPLLVAFIFCSFLVVLTQILTIPNQMLCALLDILSFWWLKILTLGSPAWLMGFVYPGVFLLIIFVCSGAVCFWLTRSWPLLWRTIMLASLFFCWIFALKLLTPPSNQLTVLYHQTPVYITQRNNLLALTINRAQLAKKIFKPWVTRTMRQELYRAFGHRAIETVILINPTPAMIKIVQECQQELGYQKLLINPAQ